MKFTFPPETRVLDGYTIKRAIHRGGFGEVYYALSDAGRETALKLLQNNSEIELRGVQQCLNLSHPNLVTIFDVRQDGDGDHWIIMEYIGGETLDAAIRRHPQGMPMEQIRKWLPGISAGVAFLHSRGLVHRDLKPANIFSDAGIVKVGDVGLSKFITPSRRSAQTQSVGTVYYMAPEVAKGRYGKEVDVYALGVILYEMLTGHVPFDGESTGEILMKHLTTPPDLSKLPPRIQPVLGRALEKDPAQRFASIEVFAEEFDDAVLGKAETASSPVPPPLPSSAKPELEVTDYDAQAAPKKLAADLRAPQPQRRLVDLPPAKSLPATAVVEEPGILTWFDSRVHAAIGVFVALVAGAVVIDGLRGGQIRMVGWLPFVLGAATFLGLRGGFKRRWAARPTPRGAALPSQDTAAFRPLALTPFAWRTRMAHWVTAAALSAGIGAGLLAGINAIAPSLFSYQGSSAMATRVGSGPQAELIAYFGATALVAAWLVVLAIKSTEGAALRHPQRSEDGLRRVALMLAGLATGAAAWGLAGFLQLDLGAVFSGQSMDGGFRSLGERPLVEAIDGHMRPTLLGFMTFFAGIFGIRAWQRQIELRREFRFRATSVLMTVLVAWLWSALFAFPQTWAMLWAAVISATVQLAAPWSPSQSRDRQGASD